MKKVDTLAFFKALGRLSGGVKTCVFLHNKLLVCILHKVCC